VNISKTSKSKRVLETFHLNVGKDNFVQFGRTNESLQSVNFSNNIRGHYSATGKWENYFFTAVLARSSIVTVTLIDPETKEHLTFYLAKDVDRSPAPWYKQWGQYLILGVLFIASQGFTIWSQRRLDQPAPAPARRPKVEEIQPDGEDEAKPEGEGEGEAQEKNDGNTAEAVTQQSQNDAADGESKEEN
jgi:hypothetical protein